MKVNLCSLVGLCPYVEYCKQIFGQCNQCVFTVITFFTGTVVNSSAQFISALLFGDRRYRVIDGARTGGKGKTV